MQKLTRHYVRVTFIQLLPLSNVCKVYIIMMNINDCECLRL